MKSVKLKDILYHHHIIPIHIETYLVSSSSLSFVFLKDIFYHHHLYHSYSHRNISSIIIIICVIDGWVWGVQVYGSHIYYLIYILTYTYIGPFHIKQSWSSKSKLFSVLMKLIFIYSLILEFSHKIPIYTILSVLWYL